LTRSARLLVGAVVVIVGVLGVACTDDSSGGSAASSTTRAPDPSVTGGRCPTQEQVDDLNGRTVDVGQTAGSYAAAMQKAMTEIAAFLPPERSADFQIMTTSLGSYLQVLSEIGDRPPEQVTADERQRLDAAVAGMGAPDVEAAAERVGDYFGENCPGIDFSSGGP
jgi:hypothetical protein